MRRNVVVKAIILFSHGSVLCGASENLKTLAQQMQKRGDADLVEVGFLNYSAPSFEEAFTRCVEKGATEIVIAPYFLVAGKFVKVDLPPKIEAMRDKFPAVKVVVADAMRFHPNLADAILSCASRAQAPNNWRDILNTAPQFCRDSEECPLHGTPKCPATNNK